MYDLDVSLKATLRYFIEQNCNVIHDSVLNVTDALEEAKEAKIVSVYKSHL